MRAGCDSISRGLSVVVRPADSEHVYSGGGQKDLRASTGVEGDCEGMSWCISNCELC